MSVGMARCGSLDSWIETNKDTDEIRLKDIGEGMERVRTVISDLRAFAYPTHHMDAKEVAIKETLASALRLTAHELRDIPVDSERVGDVRMIGFMV